MWQRVSYGLSAALVGAAIVVVQTQVAVSQFFDEHEQTLAALGKQITVIINGQNPGSGVIIAKQGNTYHVLTAKHVVATQDEYEIFTSDGTKHALDYRTVKKLPGVDLAIVQFSSNQNYQIAQLGDSEAAAEGTTVYIAGWPHPGRAITERIYQMTKGTISGRSLKPLEGGYAMVYTNITRSGMSGGPVLNAQGQVIGIHGRAEGESVVNSDTGATVDVKSGFNLGIPIKTFFDLTSSADVPANPAFAFPLAAVGYHALQGNRLSEAVAYQERAIAQDAKYMPARFYMGLAKYQQGDVEAAMRQWQTAIEIDGEKDSPNLALAAALYAKGERERGLAMASSILESKRLYTNSNAPDWEKIKASMWGDRLIADLQQLLSYFSPIKVFKSDASLVDYLAFSPDGKTLVSVGRQEVGEEKYPVIQLWNPSNGEVKKTFKMDMEVGAIAISQAQKILAISNYTWNFALLDLHTGELRNNVKCKSEKGDQYYDMALSPDGQTIASGTHFGIQICDLRTGQIRLFAKEDMVRSITFSPDGTTLASGNGSGIVKLWDVRTGQVKSTLQGHSGPVLYLAFSPDGTTLVSDAGHGLEENNIKVWNVSNGQLLHTLTETHSPVAFSPDRVTLVSGVRNTEQWNLRTGELTRRLRGSESPLAFNPDGTALVSSGKDGTIQLWQVVNSGQAKQS